MRGGFIEHLQKQKNLTNPYESYLKALGMTLCANLPPAFDLVDLRYIYGADVPSGFYYIVQYRISGKFYGFIIADIDLMETYIPTTIVQESIDWVVQKARKEANKRIIV